MFNNDNLFLGSIPQESRSTSYDKKAELLEIAKELLKGYNTGALSAEELSEFFSQLYLVDTEKVTWTLGTTTLCWYKKSLGKEWCKSVDAPAEIVSDKNLIEVLESAKKLVLERKYPGTLATKLKESFVETVITSGVLATKSPELLQTPPELPKLSLEDLRSLPDFTGEINLSHNLPAKKMEAELLTTDTGEDTLYSPTDSAQIEGSTKLSRLDKVPIRSNNPCQDSWDMIDGVADDELLDKLLGPEYA